MLLSEIAEKIAGRLEGPDVEVSIFASLDEPKQDSLCIFSNKRLANFLKHEDVKALVTNEKLKTYTDKPTIVVEDTQVALLKLLEIFYPEKDTCLYDSATFRIGKGSFVASSTFVGKNSNIGDNSIIHHNVFIGENVNIGDNCKIYPNVSIYDNSCIGDSVIIHSGVVIGSDGFGYINTKSGHVKIRQVGRVVIENSVEIGANSCIDRGAIGTTKIGEGTKIDNLVQIGHNVKIGKHCIIVSQTGIAGSCRIGDFVVIGGQVGIADHISITNNVMIASKSGVMADVEKPGIYSGAPLMEHRQMMKNHAVLKDIGNFVHKVEKKLFRGD